MATDLRTLHTPDVDDGEPTSGDLPILRFRLRQLFFGLTLFCLLMTALVSLNGLVAAVLLLATLVIAMHLFSTAIGTQLRAHSNRAIARNAVSHDSYRQATTEISPPSVSQMPRSPWHDRGSTPLPWLTRLIAGAAAVGGIAGAVLLTLFIGREASLAGIVVGSFSLAVVVGWIAFVGYSFVGVFRHGLRQASDNERGEPKI